MVPSYLLSIETPTPLVLGVGVMFAPVTCFVTFVLFGRRFSGNNLYRGVLTKCKKSSRPSGSVPTAPPTSPRAETSSGVSLPGSSSSSSLLLGGQGMREGSRGAPGVLSGGASSPPARSRSSERGGGASGLSSGARSRFSFSFGSGRSGSCPLAVGSFFPRLRLRCLSLILTARSTTWEFEGDFGVLPPRVYPPVVLDLRIEEQGRIRGPGHVGVALVDVAVVLALAPLPVRGQEVESVDSSHRPLSSLLVPARAGCGLGLLTATAHGVGALGLDVTGLDPRIDTGHAVTTCGMTGGGLLTAPGRAISVRVSLPTGEIGVTASGCTLSRIARVAARGQAGDYLALLPACRRRRQDAWPDEKPRRVLGRLPRSLLWFLKRPRLSLLLQEGRF